jgi:hypothetical protein
MAQRDKAGFKSTKDSRFADNTTGQIGADDMRNMFEDAADSFLFVTDEAIDTYMRYTDDFLANLTGPWGFVNINSGSAFYGNFGVDNTEKATGVAHCTTSTGATSGAGVITASALSALTFGFGFTYELSFRIALSDLSDGSETYTARIGFLDNSSGAPTDGAFFRYTHGTNSGKWEAVTISNSVETAEDTTIAAVAATYVTFKIVANSDATQVDFYINGVKTNDITTNIINSSSRVTGHGTHIIKSVGTTARLMYIDYIDLIVSRTTAR